MININTDNEEKSIKQPNTRKIVLVILLLMQIVIFIVLLARFADPANSFYIMYLETPIEKDDFFNPDDVIIGRYDLLNTVTLLSGSESDGKSMENRFREKMKFDPGQSMWIVVEDHILETDNIVDYAKTVMSDEDFQLFKTRALGDNIVNFIFDAGADEFVFRNNWKEIASNELKLAPFLPWKKRVDFLMLSSFDPKHWQGLAYILGHNPGMLVICPPLTRATQIDYIRSFEYARNLAPIEEGLTWLTPRLGTYVYSLTDSVTEQIKYELILLIKIEGGIAIVAGAGSLEPHRTIKRAADATGENILYYIGGTNLLIGLESDEMNNELAAIRKMYPDMIIYPNFNTSMIAHNMLRRHFEEKYKQGHLGTKIKFGKTPEEFKVRDIPGTSQDSKDFGGSLQE